jgi:hypothetical protein
LLVLLGVLFILDNFHVIDAGSLWDYWPLFLIGPGFARLIQPARPGQRIWGLILVARGTVFLLRNLDILWIPFHRVWPFVLVVVGGYLIWQTMLPRGPGSTGDGGGPAGPRPGQLGPANTIVELSEFALMGGGNRVVRSSDFRGGTVSVIAGGFDIDLREAAMTGDSATIDVFVLMGGAVFRVPKDWNVVMRATPLIGGSENKSRPVAPASEGPVKTLFISGFILIGGLEVKN